MGSNPWLGCPTTKIIVDEKATCKKEQTVLYYKYHIIERTLQHEKD